MVSPSEGSSLAQRDRLVGDLSAPVAGSWQEPIGQQEPEGGQERDFGALGGDVREVLM